MLNDPIQHHKDLTNGHEHQFNTIISILNETRSINYILFNILEPRYQLNAILTSLESPLKNDTRIYKHEVNIM